MATDFERAKCTFYKDYISPGKIVPLLDTLTKQGYTNSNLLNQLRLNGKESDFYKQNKKNLSVICASSIQDNLTIHHSENNHLFHSGFIQFDIDAAENDVLNYPGGKDELKEYLIDKIPYIAYTGSSVSNKGLWGLFQVMDRDNHYAHYSAMIEYFKGHNINLDTKTKNISSFRFLSYDPDAHIELEPVIFEDLLFSDNNKSGISEYERPDTPDSLFIAACQWVEAKHNYKFQKGYIHNYLVALYAILRHAHVSREKCLNWIYNNLIEERDITTNCLDEIEIRKFIK